MLSLAQRIVSREIDRVLSEHGISPNSRIRAEIEAHVDWNCVGERSVSICTDDNRILPLDAFVDELRHDSRYSHQFLPEPERVSRKDADKLRECFNEICKGSVVVVD